MWIGTGDKDSLLSRSHRGLVKIFSTTRDRTLLAFPPNSCFRVFSVFFSTMEEDIFTQTDGFLKRKRERYKKCKGCDVREIVPFLI